MRYEEIESRNGTTLLQRTDEDGTIWFIPMDETNSDYQAYLNKDKPVEHFTPNV